MTTRRDTSPVAISRYQASGWSDADDIVAAEEPLEIRLAREGVEAPAEQLAITMRTPGNDFDLAAGFLFGEGVLRAQRDVVDISYCLDDTVQPEQRFNVVTATVRHDLEFDPRSLERNFYTTSSCGVCGKAAIEAIEVRGCDAIVDEFRVEPGVINRLPSELRRAQEVFEQTGGLHAAGLFDAGGTLLAMREDVGRHNAVDKLIGRELLEGRTPLSGRILVLSGRASFELLQKAVSAGIPVVASVGAPSSLAVELANRFNVTLAGFVRHDSFNVYSAPERIRQG